MADDTAEDTAALYLLPLALSRPREALAAAEAVLAAGPAPYAASVARQARGIVLREFGDTSAAVRELRAALRLARRSGRPGREADVLATLGVALTQAGRTAPGLAALDAAVALSGGPDAGRILLRRGGALSIVGRHRAALDDLTAAAGLLRRAGDDLWAARALTARAMANLALGAAEASDADLREAEELFARTDQRLERAMAVHNRGLLAARLGDLPLALTRYDEARERFRALALPTPELRLDRCRTLLAAGLYQDALAEAERGIGELDRIRGQRTRRAELYLAAARAALALGDHEAARERAGAAARMSAAQRREWWHAHARLVVLASELAAGRATARLVRQAARVAARLADLGSPDAVQGHLLAGRAALALGRPGEAAPHLERAARVRRRGPALVRTGGWLAEALRAEAAGDRRRLLRACRRGLDLLDEHRITLGATEMRAQATAHGAELARLAQRAALRGGRGRDLLAWSERWRATALTPPAVRPAADRALTRDLAALREIAGLVERSDGAPALERRRAELEQRIRGRVLRTSGGPGPAPPGRLDAGELLARLGETSPATTLVEIAEVDGELHVLVCGEGRVVRRRGGALAEAVTEVEYARSGLRRMAFACSADPKAAADGVRRTALRLQRAVLGDAVPHLGDGSLVVVPPSRLHGVPWALLPALADRAVCAAPSAGAWLRARATAPPSGGGVVFVRGPGMRGGGAEVPLVTPLYDGALILRDGTATADRVLSALDGGRLAHVAAHGDFRADNPLFSSLILDDGPLTVCDLERLRRAPYHLVLPSCDSGQLVPAGADELLGLAAALLPLGTAGIVAGLVPVNDEATARLMVVLHRALAAGEPLAGALRTARLTLADDPLDWATGASFAAIGAG
ncbi:CHAT domain-containing protein [Spongiactinospora sp. TRM90649]|uniref:CHAT domain-containing protein n=1 Tax=Spongiactinospora sp. TRM90649 TaxID=3031114 RepID=UPI0023F6A21B|nr:CHAT domain-containing protein [Spongiactinospora sp. TRM90649]MDF5753813.1 CHAT domain-containing protein [Spongiactinospora sp. TRM90649]